MPSSYRKIGEFIQLVDERNNELKVTKLLGLSISKEFIPSVANTVGTNMAKYKVIRKNQFACSIMQVRRDKKMPVALLKEYDKAIISQAYPVFEVIDENELLPEYLMMWMSRSEFDRHACFLAVGGVRGSLEWEDFIEMPIPVPHIDHQRAIVEEYTSIVNRIKLNEQLNQKLEETAQALYKHWFVDFEFPDENGKPYKSSGGEMEYDEELGQETPIDWEISKVGKVLQMHYGKSLPESRRNKGEIKVYSSAGPTGYHDKELYSEKSIIVGRKGSIGTLYYEHDAVFCIDTAYFVKESDSKLPLIFLFRALQQLNLPSMNEDSAVPGLSRGSVYDCTFIIPQNSIVERYAEISESLEYFQTKLKKQNASLRDLAGILTSRMSKVETSPTSQIL